MEIFKLAEYYGEGIFLTGMFFLRDSGKGDSGTGTNFFCIDSGGMISTGSEKVTLSVQLHLP